MKMKSRLQEFLLDVRQINPLAYFNAFCGFADWFLGVTKPPIALPWKLEIVLTKACNLRCTFCVSYDSVRGDRWMDFSLYERIARKLFPSAPDGHFKIPNLWPGQNPPGDSRGIVYQ